MSDTPRYTLYVTNATGERSARTIEQARRLVSEHGQGGTLDVVDVLAHPERAEAARLLVTPTLVREWPLPVVRLVGDLSDLEQARLLFA